METLPLTVQELDSLATVISNRVRDSASRGTTFTVEPLIATAILRCADAVIDESDTFHIFVDDGISKENLSGVEAAADSLRDALAEARMSVTVYPRHGSFLAFAVKLFARRAESEGSLV